MSQAAECAHPARDEVVFMTGGGSGVGLHIARRLGQRGGAIAILDRPGGPVKDAAELVGDGVRALVCAGDASIADEVVEAVDATVNSFGCITTVVASAGINQAAGVDPGDQHAWERCLAVNLTAVFLVAKYTLPHLLSANGSFVAVTSLAGIHGAAGQPAYCAAAHGVLGLIRTMALDYGGSGVRYNVVCAGPIESGPTGAPRQDSGVGRIPFGRLAHPHEVAELVAHLTSADASYTNGSVHVLDGGASAGTWRNAE